jgi:hypothetical protein
MFGLGIRSTAPVVTAQRRLNCFYELTPDGDKVRAAIYGTPGLTLFTGDLGDTAIRGWIAIGDYVYLVHRGSMWRLNNAMVLTALGTLNTTTGYVDMAYDGAVILIVDGTNGYTYTVASSTFAQITDGDFPNGANTCDWIDGQFIVDDGNDSDSFYISANGTAWDALDFATAESQPDGIIRVFADHGELLLFGEQTIEPWGNIGASDFPFAPVKGGIAEMGLAARWSLCKFNDGLAFLGQNVQGQAQVYYLRGYTPVPISSTQLDAVISGYNGLESATGFAFMDRGHPMYQINFPGPEKSWRFDARTNDWFEVAYGADEDRHRANLQIDYLGRTLVADYDNGNIYIVDPNVYTDGGEVIARELRGRHIFNTSDRLVVNELYLDFETGVGLIDGQGEDPQIMLQISKDNGHTWGNELWTTIGKIGVYLTRAHWRRLGVAFDYVFLVRMTDPVKFALTFAALKARSVN